MVVSLVVNLVESKVYMLVALKAVQMVQLLGKHLATTKVDWKAAQTAELTVSLKELLMEAHKAEQRASK